MQSWLEILKDRPPERPQYQFFVSKEMWDGIRESFGMIRDESELAKDQTRRYMDLLYGDISIHLFGRKSRGKSLIFWDTETMKLMSEAAKVRRQMLMIGKKLDRLKLRLMRKRKTKKIPVQQKQQWRADERRRSRQKLPGR